MDSIHEECRNVALGLAIDGRTATARWDGERVDYDQGVMLAMASWETGDSRVGECRAPP